MKKLIAGVVTGVIMSIIIIDYKGLAYQFAGIGETKPTSLAELDAAYALNVLLITSVCVVLVYLLNYYITKKQAEPN